MVVEFVSQKETYPAEQDVEGVALRLNLNNFVEGQIIKCEGYMYVNVNYDVADEAHVYDLWLGFMAYKYGTTERYMILNKLVDLTDKKLFSNAASGTIKISMKIEPFLLKYFKNVTTLLASFTCYATKIDEVGFGCFLY